MSPSRVVAAMEGGRKEVAVLTVVAVAVVVGTLPGQASGQSASDPILVQSCRAILDPGDYELAANLTADESPCLSVQASDVDLDGAKHTVRAGNASGAGIEIQAQGTGPTNVTLHDVIVEGFPTANVRIDGATQVTLERVAARSASGQDAAGIRLVGSETVTLRGVQARANDVGIEIQGSADVAIAATRAASSTTDGIYALESSQIRLTNTHAEGNGQAGIRLDSVTDVRVERGSLTTNGIGADLQATSDGVLSQVAFRDSRNAAIDTAGARTLLDRIGLPGWGLSATLRDVRLTTTTVADEPASPRETLNLFLEVATPTSRSYANLTGHYQGEQVPDYQEPTMEWWVGPQSWEPAPGFMAVDVDATTVTTNATEPGVYAPTVEQDVTPPDTTSHAPTVWTNRTVAVELIASDDLSGVNRTVYRLDGGNWTSYQDPVRIWDEGRTRLGFRSIDRADNEEAPGNTTIRIDRTPPRTIAQVQGEPKPDGSFPPPAEVLLEGSDGLSEVSRTEYRIDSGSWSTYTGIVEVPEVGTHTVEYRSIDRAGNREPTRALELRVGEAAAADGSTETNGTDGPVELRIETDPPDAPSGQGPTRVDVVNASRPDQTAIVLVHPDGAEETLADGTSAQWATADYPNGPYEIQAREDRDGQAVTVASTTHLVEHARASLTEAALAVAAGVAIIAAAQAVGGQLLSWLRYLAKVVRRALGIEYRERTKEPTSLGERIRREGGRVLIAAAVLATAATLAGLPEWLPDAFLAKLPVLGAAAVVFSLIWYGGDWVLARITGQRPRYVLLGSGLVSLVVSTLAFRSPFGTPGYVDKRDEPSLEGDARTRFFAQRTLADLGLVASASLVFLPVMRSISYGFGQAGLLLVVMTLATGTVPIPPLPVHQVWRWNKIAAASMFAAGVGIYVAWQLALLPDASIMAMGAVGLVAVAAFGMRHRARPDAGPYDGA